MPEVKERIAYRIPVYSLYTMSPRLVEDMRSELMDVRVSGATIHFTPEEPIPEALVVKILRARIQELKRA